MKESEDERIRKAIEGIIRVYGKTQGEHLAGYDMDTNVNPALVIENMKQYLEVEE